MNRDRDRKVRALGQGEVQRARGLSVPIAAMFRAATIGVTEWATGKPHLRLATTFPTRGLHGFRINAHSLYSLQHSSVKVQGGLYHLDGRLGEQCGLLRVMDRGEKVQLTSFATRQQPIYLGSKSSFSILTLKGPGNKGLNERVQQEKKNRIEIGEHGDFIDPSLLMVRVERVHTC